MGDASGEVRSNLESVASRMRSAARRAGRDPDDVTLIGVTKTVPAARVLSAIESGLTHLGENRVQDAGPKIEALAAAGKVTWHMIGHLQSNKAGRAVDLFSWIHSIDSVSLARKVARRGVEAGVRPRVLVQVDLGREETKHGIEEALLRELVEEVASLEGLELRGLMTLPPWSEDPEAARPFFRRLRALRDRLAAAGPPLPDLSMGMTDDFEVAIEEGATMIRVGRALFGDRPPIG